MSGLTDCEKKILRFLNGENVSYFIPFTPLMKGFEGLSNQGLITQYPLYELTDKGRECANKIKMRNVLNDPR